VGRASEAFARDLQAEAERIGYRSGAEAASRAHVEEAERHLYVGRWYARKQVLTTVGAVVTGAAASSIISFLVLPRVPAFGVGISTAALVLGVASLVAGLLRR